MGHRITDIAGNDFGVGDYVYYGSDRGELTYAKVARIDATWVGKFSSGYWDYIVWVERINSSRWFYTAGRPVKLTKIKNIVKAPQGHELSEV